MHTTMPSFYVDAEDANSGPYAGAAGALIRVISPVQFFLNKPLCIIYKCLPALFTIVAVLPPPRHRGEVRLPCIHGTAFLQQLTHPALVF